MGGKDFIPSLKTEGPDAETLKHRIEEGKL